jgi:hypothetical protein
MKSLFSFLCCLFLMSASSHAQQFLWATGNGGPGDDSGTALCTDADGNVYMAGNIAGYADIENTTVQGQGIFDVIVTKYSPSGALIWAKAFGGQGMDKATDIQFAAPGSLYVSGYTSGTAKFGSFTTTAVSKQDAFLTKLDLSGNVQWVQTAGGDSNDVFNSLALDNNGGIYVCGGFRSNIRFGNTTLTSQNLYSESVFAKYDGNGNLQWAKNTLGDGSNIANGIAFDKNGYVVAAGFFTGILNYGNARQVISFTPSYDIYVLKLDADGNASWMTKDGSASEDAAYAIACDNNGNSYVTGYIGGPAIFGDKSTSFKGWNDLFLARHNADGSCEWVRDGGGFKLDLGTALTTDANNNIYVTGMFESNATFAGQVITETDRGILLLGYNQYGDMLWVDKAGGKNPDYGLDIAEHNGSLYVTGYYTYQCFFGEIQIDIGFNNDLFLAKYQPMATGLQEAATLHAASGPNPVADKIMVNIREQFNGSMQVVNTLGQTVLSEVWNGSGHKTIDAAALGKGAYILVIKDAHNNKEYKTSFVKQ